MGATRPEQSGIDMIVALRRLVTSQMDQFRWRSLATSNAYRQSFHMTIKNIASGINSLYLMWSPLLRYKPEC